MWKVASSSSSLLARRALTSSSTIQNGRLASTLIIAEASGADEVSPSTLATVTAAQQVSSSTSDGIELFWTGSTLPKEIPQGVVKLWHLPLDFTTTPVERMAQAVATLCGDNASSNNYGHIMGPSTKFGSNLIPRMAALMKLSPVTDVLQIVSDDTFVRPMYAGNALAKVQAMDATKMLTIRPTSFDKAPLADASGVETATVETPPDYPQSVWKSSNVSSSSADSGPDLTAAPVVIAGGRGVGSMENFAILQSLATKMGNAALGASRAAVDAGMAPNDWQVGQTGKVVAPSLYIAAGISGAIQHLSGMKDSKTIVAINTDPEAPIFSVADYGLKADLFEAVPEMTDKV